jgi:DNA repair protein RadC
MDHHLNPFNTNGVSIIVTQNGDTDGVELASMSDAHVLAAILSVHGLCETPHSELQTWLAECGGVRGLFRSSSEKKSALPGNVAMRLSAAKELVMRSLRANLCRGEPLTNPGATADYLNAALRDRSREIFTRVVPGLD